MANLFRYTTAIVRGITATLPAEAQRMSPNAQKVCYEKAKMQMQNYVNLLRNEVGLNVIELPADDTQPDCVFVEDVVVALGNTALLTNPGHTTRQPETKPMEDCLRNLGMNLTLMKQKNPKARMDGGDVLFTGKEIFVGISQRTNAAGYEVLADVFSSFRVTPVPVEGTLHLKSGCSLIKPGVILQAVGSPKLLNMAKNLQEAAKGEYTFLLTQGSPTGSNCLYIDSAKLGPTIVHPSLQAFPEAKDAYGKASNLAKFECDCSELDKVDGALTCCSVLLSI